VALAVVAAVGGGALNACSSLPASAATVAAAPSPGCSAPTASSGVGAGSGTRTVPFQAGGDAGSYLLAVPSPVAADRPLPVVFDLHGYGETAKLQDSITDLSQFGMDHGFITVTPQVDHAIPYWDFAPGSADLAFLGALIDDVEATRCVDEHRVYVAGYSNGAFMTSSLICRDADRITAVATVGGIQAPAGCRPGRPVPAIAFHGTADPFVPYQGGVGSAAMNLPAPSGTGTLGPLIGTPALVGISPLTAPIPTEEARWAARNGCLSTPMTSTAAAGVTLVKYRCPADATVELYREDGEGHVWPGSPFMTSITTVVGPTTFAINADHLLWAFFVSHPLSCGCPNAIQVDHRSGSRRPLCCGRNHLKRIPGQRAS